MEEKISKATKPLLVIFSLLISDFLCRYNALNSQYYQYSA